jgi:oligopeptide/dipeptide ABC transporter ATP-binding protein
MYAGEVVEEGRIEDIFLRSRHPYTRGLLDSIPKRTEGFQKVPLTPIPGLVPSLAQVRLGCRYYERCSSRREKCTKENPTLTGDSHRFACHFPVAVKAEVSCHE